MKKKLLIALALMLIVSVVALVACDKDPQTDPHTHAYTQWAHNDTEHWKVCECGDVANETKAAHAFVDGVCECGATEDVPDPIVWEFNQTTHWQLDDDGNVDETTVANHDYGDGSSCTVCGRYSLKAEVTSAFNRLSAYSVSLENVSIPTADENVSISFADAHVGLDENGKLFAWATVSATNDLFVPVDVDGTTATVNLKQGYQVVIKNDVVYIAILSESAYSWNDYEVYTTEGYGSVSLDVLANNLLELLGIDMTYADLKVAVSDFLAQLDSYSETVVALFDLIGSIGGEELLTDEDGESVTSFIVVTVDDKGNKTYTVDFKALHAINDILSTYTIGDYLTAIVGEDYATEIPAALEGALNLTIGDLVAAVEEQTGMTLDELIALANQIIATVMGDDTVTIDVLLQQAGILSDGVTVKDLLTDKAVCATTLGDLLVAYIKNATEQEITTERIIAAVSSVLDSYSGLTVYDIVGNLIILSEDGGEEPTIGTKIGMIVGGVIDLLDEFVHISFVEDKDGVLQSATLSLGFDEDFVLDGNSIFAGTSLVTMLQKYSGTLSVKRNVENDAADNIIKDVETWMDTVMDAIEEAWFKDEDTIRAFVVEEVLDADYNLEKIVSLEKNADGDWILTVKGYSLYETIKLDESIKEALEWTDESITCITYGYVYTFSINLNKDFSLLTLYGTPCNGKREGDISALLERQIEGVYVVGTGYDGYTWITEPISAEQLATVLNILKTTDEDVYDWLVSGDLTESAYDNKYINFIYDVENKTVAAYDENCVHDWKTVSEIDEDSLSCGYYTEVTEKCTHCNATRKCYLKGSHNYKWSDWECNGDCEEDGAVCYYRCTECDVVNRTQIRYGHTFTSKVEGDCTKSDFSRTCDVCGKSVSVSYDVHDWNSEYTYYGAAAMMIWHQCDRCTSGAYWSLQFDSSTDVSWQIQYISDNDIMWTTTDGHVIARIDDVYYYGYNSNTEEYEFYFDNATGTTIPYAAEPSYEVVA